MFIVALMIIPFNGINYLSTNEWINKMGCGNAMGYKRNEVLMHSIIEMNTEDMY